jgi:hypothetical protein
MVESRHPIRHSWITMGKFFNRFSFSFTFVFSFKFFVESLACTFTLFIRLHYLLVNFLFNNKKCVNLNAILLFFNQVIQFDRNIRHVLSLHVIIYLHYFISIHFIVTQREKHEVFKSDMLRQKNIFGSESF